MTKFYMIQEVAWLAYGWDRESAYELLLELAEIVTKEHEAEHGQKVEKTS